MVCRMKTSCAAFTLIELLVVVAIIGALAVAIVPGVRGVSDSYSLTAAADQVISTINLARQTAIARNRPVEVRIYELRSLSQGAKKSYRLVGAVIPEPSDASRDEWVDRPRPLPNGIIFDDGSNNDEFSTLITSAGSGNNDIPGKVNGVASGVPDVVREADYIKFSIRSDGSTDLNPSGAAGNDPWTLSLRVERDTSGDSTRPSNNFITLMLDPTIGRLKVFRP